MPRMSFMPGIICVFSCAAFVYAGTGSDTVTINPGDKPSDWTVARIKSELAPDITTLSYTGHDGKHTSTVVPLISLLKAAGVETQLQKPTGDDPKTKHGEMHFAVSVEGKDGYYTVFSITELMPELGNRHVFVALDVDGKPWAAAEAPIKLIVPDDQKPARWVHAVQSISVVKVDAPATQPTK